MTDKFGLLFGSGTPTPKPPAMPSGGGNDKFSMLFGQSNVPASPEPTAQPIAKETKLPVGAIGLTPGGEPDYGPGIQGWLNGFNARFNEQSYAKQEDGSYAPVATPILQKVARGLGEAGRVVDMGFSAVREGFQENLTTSPTQTLEDLAAHANDNEPSPGIKLAAREAISLHPAQTVVRSIYNVGRILSGTHKLSWEDISKTYEAEQKYAGGLNASAIADSTVRSEYMRRIAAGENPEAVVAQLRNPIAEIVYDVVIDPSWAVGEIFSAMGKANKLKQSAKVFEVLDEVKAESAALKGLPQVTTDTPEIISMANKIITRNAKGAETALEQYNSSIKMLQPWRLTSNGKQSQVATVVKRLYSTVVNAFADMPETAGEMVRAISLVGADDVEKVKEGLQIAYKINPKIAGMITSEEGLMTAQFMARMPDNFILDLAKSGNKAEMITEYSAKANAVLDDMFPPITLIAKKKKEIATLTKAGQEIPAALKKFEAFDVPEWAVKVAQAHENAQVVVRPINTFFGSTYIVANPGNLGRNIMNNVTTGAIDFGFKGYQIGAKTAQNLAGKLGEEAGVVGITKRLGYMPETLGASFGGQGPLEGAVDLLKPMRALRDKTERATRLAVSEMSLDRTMSPALREGVMFAPAESLKAAGISDDYISRLMALAKRHYGDVGKVKAEFLAEGERGVAEVWRNIEINLSKSDIYDAKAFGQGLFDNLQDALHEPTLDDAIAAKKAIAQRWADVAAKNTEGALSSHVEDPEMLDAVTNLGLDAQTADAWTTKFNLQRQSTGRFVQAAREAVYGALKTAGDTPNGTAVENILKTMDGDYARIMDSTELNNTRANLWKALRSNQGRPTRALEQLKHLPEWEKYAGANVTLQDFRQVAFEKYLFPRQKFVQDSKMGEVMRSYVGHMTNAGALVGQDLANGPTIMRAAEEISKTQRILDYGIITPKGIFFDYVDIAMKSGKPKDVADALRFTAKQVGVATKTVSGADADMHLINIINEALPEGQKITKLTDVGSDGLQAALDVIRARGKPVAEGVGLGRAGIPLLDGQMPSSGQAIAEQLPGINSLLDRFEAGLKANWGKGSAVPDLTPEQLGTLESWFSETRGRVAEGRAIAEKIAVMDGDFALLNYGEKRTFDMALAYIMPYQFWYTRSYKNWMIRLAQNPQIVSKYLDYRRTLAEMHKDLPDWWKYNLSTNDLPGMKSDNPMFFNLEASLNPLNGITGVDFNDQNKVVGQEGTLEYMWTSTVNDMSKFGPSVWSPISMLTALELFRRGEKDAAARWGGRLFPQSMPIKSVAGLMGHNLEVDPMVNLLNPTKDGSSSIDPYEIRRVERTLYAMGEDGLYSREAIIEAARSQSGPLWEAAKLRTTQERAPASLMSFFLGVGYKPRSAADMQIDTFYEDYNAVMSRYDQLSPQAFRVSMDNLRITYPFMDTVLLGKQADKERDRTYAYVVLGRIAPGDTTTIMKAAGLPANILDKFYNEKGDISKWQESDRLKFMGAVLTIGTSLAIPSNATQAEWTKARNAYKTVSDQIASQYGADIWDKVDAWYALAKDADKNAYMRQHPEVQQAMDAKAYAVATTPILATYYNGLDNIKQYYAGEFKKEVLTTLGADYYQMLTNRDSVLDPKQLVQYDRVNNYKTRLKKYNDLKKKWDEKTLRVTLDYGKNLPVGTTSTMQDVPLLSTGQQDIATALQQQNAPQIKWSDIQSQIPPTLQNALYRYFAANRPLTAAEKSTLTRTAKFLGLTADDIMQAAASATAQ